MATTYITEYYGCDGKRIVIHLPQISNKYTKALESKEAVLKLV